MRYSPPVDGLRAVAILSVLAYHVSHRALPGGFTGVDVFFVLSGHLITSVIIESHAAGRFTFREFYLRRVQRLVPNLTATVLATMALWALLMPPSGLAQGASQSIWALLGLANFEILASLGGYWGDSVEWAPLAHTWSLGVEEQFYALYPALLGLVLRWQKRGLALTLAVLAVVGFVVCGVVTPRAPEVAFYMLPTRAWELFAGGALGASLSRRTPGREVSVLWANVAGVLGLVLVCGGFVAIDGRSPFPGWIAAAPAVGTLLSIWSVSSPRSWLGRVLSSPVAVGIGKRSYSIYLWHWPLIVLGRAIAEDHQASLLRGAALGALVSLGLAELAFRFVETPLRKREPGAPWRLRTIAVGHALALGLAIPLGAVWTPKADRAGAFDPPLFTGLAYDASGSFDAPTLRTTVRYYDVKLPEGPVAPGASWTNGGIVQRHGGDAPKVAVIGSSHALMYSPLIDALCRARGLTVGFLGVDGRPAPFFAGSPAELDAAIARHLDGWRPEVVFVIDRWDGRMPSEAQFLANLRGLLRAVSSSAGRVVFVAQVPTARIPDRANLREWVSLHRSDAAPLPALEVDGDQPRRDRTAVLAESLIGEVANLVVLRPDRLFLTPAGTLRYAEGRRFFYADHDHLTDQGADEARAMFDGVLPPGPRGPAETNAPAHGDALDVQPTSPTSPR